MAKATIYYEDERGRPFKTLGEAVASDVAAILKVGSGDTDLSLGIAKTIVAQRDAIRAALAVLDSDQVAVPVAIANEAANSEES